MSRMQNIRAYLSQLYSDISYARTFFLAATIAYYALLSVFPLVLVVLVIGSIFLKESFVLEALLKNIDTFVPNGTSVLSNNVEDMARNATSIGIFGLAILLWAGMGIFSAIEYALDRIWRVPVARHILLSRLLSLAVFIVFSSLFFIATGSGSILLIAEEIISAGQTAKFSFSPYVHLISSVSSYVLVTLIFYVIYRFLPNIKLKFRDIWIGLLVATIGWQGAKMIFTGYIQTVGGLRIVYGSIVTIIATLLWFYISSLVLLFSAHLDAARYRVKQGVFVPVHPVDPVPGPSINEQKGPAA